MDASGLSIIDILYFASLLLKYAVANVLYIEFKLNYNTR